MGSSLVHNLKGLPHDRCVSLFKKFAFNEGEDDQNLMKIGDAIVRKCKGVPLAVKSLGCLLFSKRKMVDWEFVRDNEIWQVDQNKDDILPALKISYDQLPFTLKQCFLYCSVFPKDHQFINLELISHWLGYGLLRSSKSRKAEDIGQQYINELYVRGFFQDFQEFSNFSLFKMHDLFHNLALSVTQKELNSMKGERQHKEIYKRIRHVSFSRSEGLGGEEVQKLFLTKKSSSSCVMPTIWSVFFDEAKDIAQLVKTCISVLKHLRSLDLRFSSSLDLLPSSIGSLKHLRSLNLQGCVRLKRLPDSICQLYNLQSLCFEGCAEMEELPKNIGDLVNLTELRITTRQKRLSEGVGNGIESLRSLQLLSLRGCKNLEYVFESGANETHQPLLWTSLQMLTILRCRSLTCLVASSPSMKISHLETLGISDCPSINVASIFNDQIRLRTLLLEAMPQMESLPQWMSVEGCATTLESLYIDDCPNLTLLPEWLSKLSSLRQLIIVGCPKLLCVPEGLSTLKELVIGDCPELSERCKQETGEDWPKIKHIPKIELDGELQ